MDQRTRQSNCEIESRTMQFSRPDSIWQQSNLLVNQRRLQKRFLLSETFRTNYSISDGILYYQDRLVVHSNHQNSVMMLYHDHTLFRGHFGVTVTFGKIAPIYYWPKLQSSTTTTA